MTFLNSSPQILHRTLADRFVEVATRSALAIARSVRTSRAPAPTAALPVPAVPDVTIIDDPEGAVRLIGVRGRFDRTRVAELAAAIDSGTDLALVHVDFTAADIAAADAIEGLETTFDRAERCGLRLRVVGLDPEHPALLRRTIR